VSAGFEADEYATGEVLVDEVKIHLGIDLDGLEETLGSKPKRRQSASSDAYSEALTRGHALSPVDFVVHGAWSRISRYR
jgi:hypothetical protein